jgi:hypothetical protein
MLYSAMHVCDIQEYRTQWRLSLVILQHAKLFPLILSRHFMFFAIYIVKFLLEIKLRNQITTRKCYYL